MYSHFTFLSVCHLMTCYDDRFGSSHKRSDCRHLLLFHGIQLLTAVSSGYQPYRLVVDSSFGRGSCILGYNSATSVPEGFHRQNNNINRILNDFWLSRAPTKTRFYERAVTITC